MFIKSKKKQNKKTQELNILRLSDEIFHIYIKSSEKAHAAGVDETVKGVRDEATILRSEINGQRMFL